MPTFNYKGRNTTGAVVNGEIVARSETDAVRLLRGEGVFVVGLETVDTGHESAAAPPAISFGFSRVKTDDVIYFVNQLAAMVDTGVPIADALEATIDKSPPGAFRNTVEDVIRHVQEGMDFSAALATHPRVFSPLMINMVRASETTGTLGAALVQIADYMAEQRDIRKRIKGALTYPACMLLFAFGATVFLLTFVLPKLTAIYAAKASVLPTPTRILIGLSGWMVNNWLYLIIGTVVGIIAMIRFFRSSRGGYLADWLRLNTPVIGPMFRQACLARSLRTLGAMIASGVSVLEAVLITRDVVGNRMFYGVFAEAHRRLQQGEQLSQALLNAPYFPRPIWQMLYAGEKTGQLGQAMDRVAGLCESDLKHTIRTTTQFIEPAMIVIMGAVIGTIALAMLMPIFQISRVMTQ